MTVHSTYCVVYVASRDEALVVALRRVLSGVQVVGVADAEALLLESRVVVPDVVLLSTDLPSSVPLGDVLSMLRSRSELAYTHWIVMGGRGLGPFLEAGADAFVSDKTSAEAVAVLMRTHLARVRQVRSLGEREAAQQARLEAATHEERVRDQLVHMLVHDLKNPISAILGLLDVVIEDGKRVPVELLDLLKLSREECQHLLHLAVNMLDVRKMKAGKMYLSRTTLFAPGVRDVLELAKGDVGIGVADRHLDIDVPVGLSPVQADPEILRRVFANLISNAVKHTVRGGRIVITAREAGGSLEWCVIDDGEGIPAEDIPNLFSAFEQSRLTLHNRFDTGMGLAFCKLAIEEHGGRITVESERGRGATFRFTLPVVREEEDDFIEVLSS